MSKTILAILVIWITTFVSSTTAHAKRETPDWLVNAFLCIHRFEGRWNDPDPPYYGGLQMDWNFMRAYGAEYLRRWGTADHWPPSVQIQVAIRAYNSGRGFNPWPNTRRMCGL